MEQQQRPRWRPTIRQVLWTLGIVAGLTIPVLIGYRYGITLWDWLKLLVVPAVIAGGGIWFNRSRESASNRLQTSVRKTRHYKHIWMGWRNC